MAPIPRSQEYLLPLSTTVSGEKSTLEYSAPSQRPVSPPRSKMASARTLLIALLVGCFVVVGFAHTDPAEVDNICLAENGHVCGEAAPSHDRSALSRLINSASPDALHKFLHTVTGFQHGVFDSDEAAVEAVLEHNPTLSSTVAQLQRRQNSTTTDIPPPPVASPTISSTTTTTQETTPSAVTSTTTTTTPVEQPSTSQTTEATPTLPTTTTEPTTAPTSTTTTTTQPTSTEQVPTTTPTTPTAPTTPAAPTTTGTTNPTTQGTPTTNRPVTTPKTNTLTSTLPGGAVTTMVSIVWVTPGVSETPTKSNTADASLQSGLAVAGRRSSKLEVFVGGAVAIVGGAMLV